MFPSDPTHQFQILAMAALVGSFVWALIETRLSIRIAHHLDLLAPVTPRSAHKVPTPTIGGLAVVDTVLIAAIILNILPRTEMAAVHAPGLDARLANWLLILCAAAMAGMGLVDDWRVVRPGPKLAIQVACALPPAWFFRHGAWLGEDVWGGANAEFMTFALNFMWIMVVINIFNFMDGMDGLAGLFTAVVATTIGALVILQTDDPGMFVALGEVFFIALALIGASLGFLRHNLPPAQTFMGDVGSQFLGWLLATLALMAHVPLTGAADSGRILWPAPWAPLLLFLPFLGDGLFTMARRARHGENIFTPHFTHLYQRLLTCGRSHADVLFVEALLMFACAGLTIALLFLSSGLQPLLGISGVGLMAALWLHVRAAEQEKDRGDGPDS